MHGPAGVFWADLTPLLAARAGTINDAQTFTGLSELGAASPGR
jgi:hypothetical protein